MTAEAFAKSLKRVTLVANEFRGLLPVGGMGTATTFLALALARMGHSVEILFAWQTARPIDPYWADVYARAGIRIRAAAETEERTEPQHFAVMRSVEVALRSDPPDVVVVHDLGAPAYSALRLRDAGLGFEESLFAVFCHGTRRWVTEMGGRIAVRDLEDVLTMDVLEQASVELADVVVSPSAYLVEWMRDHGWRMPERTLVIPYITRSTARAEQPEVALSDGGQVRRLAFFGRLEDKKGIRPFAAALNALEPDLLDGLELEFLGKSTATWTPDRIETLFSTTTRHALRGLLFETALDQPQVLARLRRPGTLAVIPSLGDNSPNTVYECLEHAIPFIASNVGGIPELIVPEDRARVLFDPTPAGVEDALRRVLAAERVPDPPRPAFDGAVSSRRWAEVIDMRPAPRSLPTLDRTVDVVVVHRRSREALARCLTSLDRQSHTDFRVTVAAVGRAGPDRIRADVVVSSDGSSVELARRVGLRAGSAPYVVFLDEEDVPDDELLTTLVRAQAASGADVVSCAIRVGGNGGEPTVHFFSGESGGLGALSNVYGNVALFRRSVLDNLTMPGPAEHDADWPLFARLEVSGARIVSVPLALVTRSVHPGRAERDSSDALRVATELERALPGPLRSTVRLAAGLVTNARVQAPAPPPRFPRRALRRLLRSVR